MRFVRLAFGCGALAGSVLAFCSPVLAAGPAAGSGQQLARFVWLLATALLLAAFLAIGGCGLLATLKVIFPRRSARILAALTEHPWRCLALGLANIAVLLFLMAVLHKAPPLAGLLAIVLALTCCFGLAGASERFGARILAADGRNGHGVFTVAVGWCGLVFAALIPVIGWLVLAVALASGVGAVIMSFFRTAEAAQGSATAQASDVK